MLVNVFHDSPWEHRRLQLAGVVLIVTMALLLGLSIAIYNKKFTNFTTVTVKADRAGLQLAKFGDVRLHGALVGRVASIKSDGKQAVITLSLSPDAARTIPDDVSVRILPTTLFGQNFLELVPPDPGTSAGPLKDGLVIPASRVETNVELQQILADLYPLLRSVRPADLNATLYAVAHALQGNGDQLGDTLVSLDDYLATDEQRAAEAAQGPAAALGGVEDLRAGGTRPHQGAEERDGDRAHHHPEEGRPQPGAQQPHRPGQHHAGHPVGERERR